jgi:hypothetical protein
MPFLPALGSRLVVGGEDQKYEPVPEKVAQQRTEQRSPTTVVVIGEQVPKTLHEHVFKYQRAPRGEVVQAKNTTSTNNKRPQKTSQYKRDLLTSKES